jgi:hypothetical protein
MSVNHRQYSTSLKLSVSSNSYTDVLLLGCRCKRLFGRLCVLPYQTPVCCTNLRILTLRMRRLYRLYCTCTMTFNWSCIQICCFQPCYPLGWLRSSAFRPRVLLSFLPPLRDNSVVTRLPLSHHPFYHVISPFFVWDGTYAPVRSLLQVP